jgi:hypothetical protein
MWLSAFCWLGTGYQARYETAIVVSNDSDLVSPIKIVREELGLRVGIYNLIRRSRSCCRKSPRFVSRSALGF